MHPKQDMSKNDAIDEDEDFILPDGLTTVEAPRPKMASQMPAWSQFDDGVPFHAARNHRLMFKALLRDEPVLSKPVDVSVVTDEMRQMLDDIEPSAFPLGTL
jgi:hypothetical protein